MQVKPPSDRAFGITLANLFALTFIVFYYIFDISLIWAPWVSIIFILIIPGRFEIRDEDPLYRTLRQMMHRALNKRTVDVVDPFDEFVAVGYSPTHFKHDGHWSSLGHKIAGKKIANKLKYLNTGIK